MVMIAASCSSSFFLDGYGVVAQPAATKMLDKSVKYFKKFLRKAQDLLW
jgi:hypothetical protein